MKIRKTVVVKIGSSVLFTKRNKLDEFRIAHIADQITSLREVGIGVALVISGAVACGSKHVDLIDSVSKRMAAGIGQVIITSTFSSIFNQKGCQIAQVLVTKADLNSKKLVNVLNRYISEGFVPVINENDVADLNSFGGNDFLGAEITILLRSKRLIVLSTMEGSIYGIGGKRTKHQVMKQLRKQNIKTEIFDGKVKNILLNSII